MTAAKWPPASTRTEFSEHTDDCRDPRFIWQAALAPNLPRRGYCPNCGAVSITDRTPPPTGTKPANKRRKGTR